MPRLPEIPIHHDLKNAVAHWLEKPDFFTAYELELPGEIGAVIDTKTQRPIMRVVCDL
jgi:hypothetical protein